MSVSTNPWADVKDAVESVAQDETLSPDARISKLKLYQDDLNDLLGRTSSYIGSLELVRDGRPLVHAERVMEARGDADLREVLLERGVADAETLDALAYVSHEELDRLSEEGLLDEWLVKREELRSEERIEEAGLGDLAQRIFDAAKHPRGSHGRFSDVLGRTVAPKGRRGALPKLPHGHAAAGRELPVHDEDRVAAFRGKAEEVGRHKEVHPTTTGGVAEVLGAGVKDTQDLHGYVEKVDAGTQVEPGSGPGAAHYPAGEAERRVYSAKRVAEVHDRIIDTLLRQRKHERNKKTGKWEWVPDEHGAPIVVPAERKSVWLAGGTASGKDRSIAFIPEHVPHRTDAVYIDPDEIKKLLPEYQKILDVGDPAAAAAVHEESSALSKRLLREATARGLSLVMNGTGDSKPGGFANKIREFDRISRKEGHVYPISVVYFDAPVDVALQREQGRAKRSGRKVAESTVRSVHAGVSANFPFVEQLHREGIVHSLAVYDTTGDAPRLIAGGH